MEYIIITYASILIIIITAIASILLMLSFSKFDSLMQKIMFYIVVGCLFEIASSAYIKIFHANNLFFFHGFAIFEAWILTTFFLEFYKKNSVVIQQKYVLFPLIGFLLLNSTLIQPITTFNSNGLTLVGVVAIAYCIYAFYLMLEKEIVFPFYLQVKWFIIAVFLTHSGTLIFELFSNQILRLDQSQQELLWSIRSILLITTRLIFFYISIQTFSVKRWKIVS